MRVELGGKAKPKEMSPGRELLRVGLLFGLLGLLGAISPVCRELSSHGGRCKYPGY